MQGFSEEVSGCGRLGSGSLRFVRLGSRQGGFADFLFFVFPDEPVHGDTGTHDGEGEGECSVSEVVRPCGEHDERGGGREGEKHEKESQPENELIQSRAGSVGTLGGSFAFRAVPGRGRSQREERENKSEAGDRAAEKRGAAAGEPSPSPRATGSILLRGRRR